MRRGAAKILLEGIPMQQIVLLIAVFSAFLQACAPVPAVARVTATRTPVPKSSPTPKQGLADISLAVGYGAENGSFQLYFTDPANPAASQRSAGPDEPLVAAIDAAHLSIDAALYSLSLRSVRQALVRAHRRGIDVRVVMESDNLDAYEPQALKDAGVPVLGDRREGLMHNKFLVIDRAEVWTGSMNTTKTGAYDDRNNLIRIRSADLATDYEAEFNEMFVDDRFGPDRAAVTPLPHLNVDQTPVDVYFSPEDHVEAALLDILASAQSSIEFLAYSFTSDPRSEAIRSRAEAGVRVRGVMDDGQVKTNTGTEYDRFRIAGLDVRLDGEPGLMHHKVMIIDRQTVVVGSYNFTASAEETNDENLLVIHSPEIAAQFLQEFRRVYAAVKP
jgi:phosphatidylserine/phosphatidylglycerophosphate/cardiolipin synthase-like enzyme